MEQVHDRALGGSERHNEPGSARAHNVQPHIDIADIPRGAVDPAPRRFDFGYDRAVGNQGHGRV